MSILRLLAWLSPAFPTGGYAWSHGVEWAVECNDIADGPSLLAWVDGVLRHGAGRNDAILLRHAHRASRASSLRGARRNAAIQSEGTVRAAPLDRRVASAPRNDGSGDLTTLADLACATSPSRERHAEAIGQGNAFRLAAGAWDASVLTAIEGDLPYPVAVGALAGAHGISEDDATLALLQAFAANLISAAVRLVPLGQSTGLAVLASLEPVILEVAADTRAASLDDLGGCAFRSDLASLRHETQYTRLFRS